MNKATMDNIGGDRPCAHCQAEVRLTRESLATLLAAYLREHDEQVADEKTYASRLAMCMKCSDLIGGCTCRHCGCFVQIRARLAGKSCPSPAGAKW
jgi:hypothetical protein